MTAAPRKLPQNPYAAEPLSTWESRLWSAAPGEERFRAFDAVVTLAEPATVLSHALRLCDDAEAELRAAAARWLARGLRRGDLAAEQERMTTALEHRLDDADPDVQLEAALGVAVRNTQLPRFAEVVRQLLAHDDIPPTTQAALAELCGYLPQPSDLAAASLKSWLTTGTAEVREAAATALARWGSAASVAETELAAALDDEEPIVREQAARALGQLIAIAPDTRAALRLTTGDEDVAVADAAKAALHRHQH